MKNAIFADAFALNDGIAAMNRQALRKAGVFTVSLCGPPGSGKTSLIDAAAEQLGGQLRIGAIVGNLAAARDAARLSKHCVLAEQVQTASLEAQEIRSVLEKIDLSQLDLLFIENSGNTLAPVDCDLGQDLQVSVFSVAGGDDKAAKYPYLVEQSQAVLLNKADLLPHVSFDHAAFCADVRGFNPLAPIIEVSAVTRQGLDAWIDWLTEKRCASTCRTCAEATEPSECYVG